VITRTCPRCSMVIHEAKEADAYHSELQCIAALGRRIVVLEQRLEDLEDDRVNRPATGG